MGHAPGRLQRKGKLIVLPVRHEMRITQYDFEEFLLLTRRLQRAEARWKAKRRYISQALRMGASVEPGVHYAVFEEKLIVR